MLTTEPPLYFIRGVTIFHDHLDLDLFYYLPCLPELTSFALYKYKVSIAPDGSGDPTRAPGAGMALFEVEIPPPKLAAITSDLASQSGREHARLVPVICSSAGVHAIIAKTDGDKLFDDLVETHAAPLVEPFHTAFALALTAEGATLMEKAVTAASADGTTAMMPPVGVVYELRFLALTPALHAHVTMNYEEAYKHFSASFGFTYYYVKAAIDLDIAWLVEHDFIKIDIISFTDTDDEQRQRTQVMDLISARIHQDFFRSGLPPQDDSPAPSGPLASILNTGTSNTKVSSASALFVLKAAYEVQNQLKTFELTFDSRTAVELTHTAAAHLTSLVQGQSPTILAIDTRDSFFSKLEVKVLPVVDFASLDDLRDAVVDVSFGDVRQSYAVDPQKGGPFTFAAALSNPAEDEYAYAVTYDFDLTKGYGSAQLSSGPRSSRSRVLVVDPLLHFQYRQVRFTLGPIDPSQVPRIHVRARVPAIDPTAPNVAQDDFLLDAAHPEHVMRVHTPLDRGPVRVRVKPSWEDPHGRLHDGDETEVTSDLFVVLGPYADVIPLYVLPSVDWAKVTQVLVEIRYEDGDYVLDKTLTFSAAGHGAGQHLDIPLLDAAKRTYRWKQTVFLNDGTSTETDFADADSAVLAPAWHKATTGDVHVVWVGTPGDAFGVRVDFWADAASGDEQQVSAFLRTGVDGDKVVTLPLSTDGTLSYRYQATKISSSGETALRSATGQSSPMVVIQTS